MRSVTEQATGEVLQVTGPQWTTTAIPTATPTCQPGAPERGAHDGGYVLLGSLLALIIGSLLVSATAAALIVTFRTTESTYLRVSESNDVLLLSDTLGTDVNSMTRVTSTSCGSEAGLTRLIGIERADLSRIVYYGDQTARMIQRRVCAGDGTVLSLRSLVRELSETTAPIVTCDGGSCDDESSPAEISMLVTQASGFEFELVGARRFDPGLSSGGPGAWTFVILGEGPGVVKATGGSLLTVNGDAFINSVAPDWFEGESDGLDVTGTITQGPIPDPYATLPVPDVGTLPVYTDGKYHGPGVYRDKPLTIGDPTVFASGTYITERGFKIQGSGGVTGSEIFIYNGCAVGSPADCKNEKTVISGSGALDVTPPSSGTYAGMVLFHGRGNTQDITVSGGSIASSLDGIIYAPDTNRFTMGSGSAQLTVGGIVATKVETSGGGNIVVGT